MSAASCTSLGLSTEPRVVRLKASPAPLLNNLSTNGLHYAYVSKRRVHMVPVMAASEPDGTLHTRVPYSPTGAIMASGWDRADGRALLRLASTDAVTLLDATGTQTVVKHALDADDVSLFFSAAAVVPSWKGSAGAVLLAGMSTGAIRVVDILSGQPLAQLDASDSEGDGDADPTGLAHDSCITALVAIAPDDANATTAPGATLFVSADDSGSVIVWDAASGAPVRSIHSGDGIPVTAVVAHGSTVVAAFANGVLRFFSLSDPELITEVHAHARVPTGLALMGSRPIVVSASHDSCVYAFDFTDLTNVTQVFAATVDGALLQGVAATSSSIAVVSYDSHKLRIFK
ncbi:uncharacterized protein AMSG_04393 [Thecamonas trahens ATCC 50062]|uniref:WD repeat-containing protein 54 beta-propeller domain-containing protein n=1 Tax=Thecamonas trahens ATCC 50062 TaxID=461836 RepID=A0A0L0D743_THETB|nr:hypothetical protein AMSG_04393 [Thecamonas trahens ATCC 50062]KNC48164.1 hypothetical protein AMSG_04393 [Thecamonas trahens ATCC 50062]|eukprot:XP_013758734.1 hypothetical protein AMSG_04393 [Thecamonas trahens ATCC 50062]